MCQYKQLHHYHDSLINDHTFGVHVYPSVCVVCVCVCVRVDNLHVHIMFAFLCLHNYCVCFCVGLSILTSSCSCTNKHTLLEIRYYCIFPQPKYLLLYRSHCYVCYQFVCTLYMLFDYFLFLQSLQPQLFM